MQLGQKNLHSALNDTIFQTLSNDLEGLILGVHILQGRIFKTYGDFVMIIDCKYKLKNKGVKQLKFTPLCIIHVFGMQKIYIKKLVLYFHLFALFSYLTHTAWKSNTLSAC